MSSKTRTSRPRLSIPKNSSKSMKPQTSRPTTSAHDFMDISRTIRGDDYSPQDEFSLSPGIHAQNGFNDLSHWSLHDNVLMSSDLSSTSEATEESFDTRSMSAAEFDVSDPNMLPFSSFSPPLFSRTTGSMEQSIPELSHADLTDSHNSPQLCFSDPQGYQAFPSLLNFSYDTESSRVSSIQNCDSKPAGIDFNGQAIGDSDTLAGQDSWGSLSGGPGGVSTAGLAHPTSQFARLPATPPLSEASQDIPVSSACSQSYSVYREPAFVELPEASTLPTQTFSIGEPFYPITPPLSEQDPNRTIRPVKQPQRPLLSAATARPSDKTEPELYNLPIALGPRFKEGSENRSPRDHPFYSMSTQNDGKYHCPFSAGEKACAHAPTTQKCAYHKYLDSHLKPYRCKVPQCVDAHFSSNACLFRHEREAHGMHGHGENPHLCHFPSCERSIPGNGFPRRWNLHDHMRRVHDYTASEKASSPEGSPVAGQKPKKKDSAVRKRKASSGTQTMKRARSTQSQAAQKAAQAQNDQQLRNAERNYYNCLQQIQTDLSSINPQDPALHDKLNARLQELHTHGLNYRYIRAGQVTGKRASGVAS